MTFQHPPGLGQVGVGLGLGLAANTSAASALLCSSWVVNEANSDRTALIEQTYSPPSMGFTCLPYHVRGSRVLIDWPIFSELRRHHLLNLGVVYPMRCQSPTSRLTGGAQGLIQLKRVMVSTYLLKSWVNWGGSFL